MHMSVEQIKWAVLALLFILNVGIWYAVLETQQRTLRVAFLDVGQGDAIYIEAPDNTQLLIDGGSGSQVVAQLSQHIPFYDRSIDAVMTTHPDRDHIGGIPDVLKRYDVSYIFTPGIENDTGAYTTLMRIVEEKGIHHVRARRGMRIRLQDNVVLSILFPDRDVRGVDTNAASIIAHLDYGDSEFLFTGDAPDAMERHVSGIDGEKIESDVLKVGHHGSDTSTTDTFLAAVSPTYAVISAGADNRYGHPHEEVLNQLKEFEVQTFGTYDGGAVVFESDGESIDVIN